MKILPDFKMAIVVDDSLSLGLQCNTASVLSLTLGKEIENLIGADLKDANQTIHKGLTKYPLPILKTDTASLRTLYKNAKVVTELLVIDITDAAQTTTNYPDYEAKLKIQSTEDLQILGLAIAGPKKLVNKFTGNLALLR